VMAIRVSGPQIPGDVWIWNVEPGQFQRATHSDSAGIDLAAMVIPEHHSFPSLDGTVIHGLLYRPPNVPAGKKLPVLLSVHGGPTIQARPSFNGPHQYLLSRGVAVFDLNYRGSTGYGKSFARLNDGRLRENELQDLEAAVDWLGEHAGVDVNRIAVMGMSYGGYLTMAAMTRLPERFASGVPLVGVSNWVTAFEGASPSLKASDRYEYGDIDDPDDREFFLRISPISHVENVRSPMMVLHGANDPVCPVIESDQFVRAIRERGGEVEYLRFPDEGHLIRRLPNQIIAYRRIAAFLERTLGIE
jgi:dipeptidyl aminopeptidase/acylaminoacyl peptidase